MTASFCFECGEELADINSACPRCLPDGVKLPSLNPDSKTNNYVKDARVRNNADLIGREAYEASLRACPNYQNGNKRPSWDQLNDAARWSWSRPTQRP